MKSVSIALDDDVKARWEELANVYGINPGREMREAIAERLEELEDFYVARSRLAQPFTPVANDDVWKRFGVPGTDADD